LGSVLIRVGVETTNEDIIKILNTVV